MGQQLKFFIFRFHSAVHQVEGNRKCALRNKMLNVQQEMAGLHLAGMILLHRCRGMGICIGIGMDIIQHPTTEKFHLQHRLKQEQRQQQPLQHHSRYRILLHLTRGQVAARPRHTHTHTHVGPHSRAETGDTGEAGRARRRMRIRTRGQEQGHQGGRADVCLFIR
uniref:HDC02041 n=1 Tax=Drosophila melanogaster TaxID=7227 RepID=Q6IHN9_DROME|nr:TPA_inf: HDC02041 [Drosophila melanogaster]